MIVRALLCCLFVLIPIAPQYSFIDKLSYGGKPVNWTLPEFCGAVAKGGAAPGLQARVVSMEHAGGAAMARLEALDWRGTRYTDFFVLVRSDEGWRIDSKVFYAHAGPETSRREKVVCRRIGRNHSAGSPFQITGSIFFEHPPR